MPDRIEVCGNCRGTGEVDSETGNAKERCTWCDGSGKQNSTSERFVRVPVTVCAECGGTGLVPMTVGNGTDYCSCRRTRSW